MIQPDLGPGASLLWQSAQMIPSRNELRRLLASRRQQLRRKSRPPRWGNLRHLEPFSASFGFDRGTPIDRYYMAQFFTAHADAFRGAAGEVADSTFVDQVGRHRISDLSIIDNDPTNQRATMIADISAEGSLPSSRFDCLVIAQTLQYIANPEQAVEVCFGAVRPGGALLLAVPALTAHDRRELPEGDYWRFWPAGFLHLLRRAAPGAIHTVAGYGNLVTATAFLQGLSAEELSDEELAYQDSRYPIVICARVDKRD